MLNHPMLGWKNILFYPRLFVVFVAFCVQLSFAYMWYIVRLCVLLALLFFFTISSFLQNITIHSTQNTQWLSHFAVVVFVFFSCSPQNYSSCCTQLRVLQFCEIHFYAPLPSFLLFPQNSVSL